MQKASTIHKGFQFGVLFFVSTWLMSHASFSQCNSANTLTIPDAYRTSSFNGNGNFNAIVFGNFTSSSGDTEGRLAVGGNFTYSPAVAGDGYSVGLAGPGTGRPDAPAQSDNFIVNGLFTNQSGINWRVRGNFLYTANSAGSALPSHALNEGTNTQDVSEGRIKFSTLKGYYINLSQNLAGSPTVGMSSVNAQNELILTGNGALQNYVFTVNLPTGIITGVTFANIPIGSSIVINILNPTVSITAGAMASTYQDRTLFNFPNATTITSANFLLEGAVLAPNATFDGSNGAINGQSVIGGSVTQSQGFEFHNSCFNQPNPLPVTLANFVVTKVEQATQLTWTTMNETNNRGFAIEHSLDAKSWKQLTWMTGIGTSTEAHTYTYRHDQPGPGNNYYRLGQIDYDGKTSYSSILAIAFEDVMVVYPNPVTEKVYLHLPQSDQYPYQITLLDGLGRPVLTLPKRTFTSAVELDVHQLNEGVYLLRLSREGNVSVRKIIVKH